MVWYGENTVSNMNTCGNMLVEIVQNHRRNKQNTVFEKQSVLANKYKNVQNSDSINNLYNFNFNSVPNEYRQFFDISKMGGLNYDTDLIGSSFYNPYKSSTPVDIAAAIAPVELTSVAPAASVEPAKPAKTSFLGNVWNNIKKIPQKVANFFGNLVDYAMSFIGKINCDRDGNRMFSPNGRSQAWCADFVTYCVRNTLGNKIPSDFGSSAVSGLRDWGNAHSCYFSVPQPKSVSAMRNYLKNNVKPGDIMIQKDNGRSHTGIVKSVASDGSSYVVVEGNSSDKVQTVTYHVNKESDAGIKYISGFVSLSQFA